MIDTPQEQVLGDAQDVHEPVEPTTAIEEGEGTSDGVAPQQDEIQVPENWEPEVREFINSIQDQAGKKAVFEKISNYDKGYQKKYQDLAGQRKEFEANKSFLENYQNFEKSIEARDEILAQYGSVPAYMQALHRMDMLASKDPKSFLINFCNNLGVTAETLQEYLNSPESKNHREARSQEDLKSQIMQEFEEKQREAEFVKEVIAFRDAKDEGGNLLHPHLEELANVMEALKSVNGNSSLEELYQMALYTRPDLREEAIKKEAKRITNANDVQRAKSVIGVKAQIPAVGAKESKGWKDVLSDSLNE